MSRLTIIDLQIAFYTILFDDIYNNSRVGECPWK